MLFSLVTAVCGVAPVVEPLISAPAIVLHFRQLLHQRTIGNYSRPTVGCAFHGQSRCPKLHRNVFGLRSARIFLLLRQFRPRLECGLHLAVGIRLECQALLGKPGIVDPARHLIKPVTQDRIHSKSIALARQNAEGKVRKLSR